MTITTTTTIDIATLRKIVDELERQICNGVNFELRAVTDETCTTLLDVIVHPYVIDPVNFWYLKPGGGA